MVSVLRGAFGALLFVGAGVAQAQIPLPTAAPPPDGASLFRNQCATCHTLDTAEPLRQGPMLKGIVGRRAGTLPGFHYTAGFAQADWTWDDAHLDTWLTNPQAMIPGTIMAYRQSNADTRARIIAYLKEQS
jgi:cytochrome c